MLTATVTVGVLRSNIILCAVSSKVGAALAVVVLILLVEIAVVVAVFLVVFATALKVDNIGSTLLVIFSFRI